MKNNDMDTTSTISNLQQFLTEYYSIQSPKIHLIQSLINKVESSIPKSKQAFYKKGSNSNRPGLNLNNEIKTNLTLSGNMNSKAKKSHGILKKLQSLHSSEKDTNSDFGKDETHFEPVQDRKKDSQGVLNDEKTSGMPIFSLSVDTCTGALGPNNIKNKSHMKDVLKIKIKCRSADLIYSDGLKVNIDDLIKSKFTCKEEGESVSMKGTKSDIIYSIMIKSNILDPIRALGKDIWKELSEEDISLDFQSYNTIASIQFSSPRNTANKHKNLSKTDSPPVKLKAIELDQLQQNIKSIINRNNISRSRAISSLDQLLCNILAKFSLDINLENRKSDDILIDFISLPFLLSQIVEPDNSLFARQLIVYTYDLYMSPMDLLLYLIAKFFSLNCQKKKILEFIEFWLEERTPDFALDSSLDSVLKSFLDSLQSRTDIDDPAFLRAVKSLQSTYKTGQHAVFAKRAYLTHSHSLIQPKLILEERFRSKNPKSFNVTKSFNFDESKEPMFYGLVTPPKRTFTSPVNLQTITASTNTGLQTLLAIPAIEIAKQLTLMEWKSFSRVNIREVIKMRWTKNDKAQCPNYWKYVSHFNNFSYWLQYIILIQQNHVDQLNIVKRFIDIAFLCREQYRNYSTPHYIFSALSSLKNFGVLDFGEFYNDEYEELKSIFVPKESQLSLYDRIYRDIQMPAVPSLISFLKIFQKLQEGVAFEMKLPESKIKYLNLSRVVQVQDYWIEMKKFQKKDYDFLIEKDRRLYSYLKEGFKKDIPVDLENSDGVIQNLTELAQKYNKQHKITPHPKNGKGKENRFLNIAGVIFKKRETV